MGDLDAALAAIKKSIELDPEGDYARYLSYAQLVTGSESRDAYNKAVSLLQAKLECLSSSDSDDASMVCTVRWSNLDRWDPKMGVFLRSAEATPCGHLFK
jgi:hypothetical protein